MMQTPHSDENLDWLQRARERGYGGVLLTALDVIEPVAPAAAALLWMMQPAGRMFGAGTLLGAVAHLLDKPGGIDQMREVLRR